MTNRLFTCRECGVESSRWAETCPHCGVFTPYDTKVDDERTPTQKKDNLTQCPDCQQEISRRAETCPHCGVITSYGRKMAIDRNMAMAGGERNRNIHIWPGVIIGNSVTAFIIALVLLVLGKGYAPLAILSFIVGIIGLVIGLVFKNWLDR